MIENSQQCQLCRAVETCREGIRPGEPLCQIIINREEIEALKNRVKELERVMQVRGE